MFNKVTRSYNRGEQSEHVIKQTKKQNTKTGKNRLSHPWLSKFCMWVFTSWYKGRGIALYVFLTGMSYFKRMSILRSRIHPVSQSSLANTPLFSLNSCLTRSCCSPGKWLRSTGGSHPSLSWTPSWFSGGKSLLNCDDWGWGSVVGGGFNSSRWIASTACSPPRTVRAVTPGLCCPLGQ